MKNKYKIEFIQYWNNSFGGNEDIIATYASSEISELKIDPLKFMEDNFFVREARECSFKLLVDNFLFTQLMNGEYSTEINIIFYYNIDGILVGTDGNNPPDEDDYESKEIILQDLYKIFIKVYDDSVSSGVVNNKIFTGVIDTNIQSDKTFVTIKAKDTTWFISKTFDKFSLSAIYKLIFGSKAILEYYLINKHIYKHFIYKVFKYILDINNIIDVNSTLFITTVLERTAIQDDSFSNDNFLPKYESTINNIIIPNIIMPINDYDVNLTLTGLNLLGMNKFLTTDIKKKNFLANLLFNESSLNLEFNNSIIYYTKYIRKYLISGNNVINDHGSTRCWINMEQPFGSGGFTMNPISIRYFIEFLVSYEIEYSFANTHARFKFKIFPNLIKNINGINTVNTNSPIFNSQHTSGISQELRDIRLNSGSIGSVFVTEWFTTSGTGELDQGFFTKNQILDSLLNENEISTILSNISYLNQFMPTTYNDCNKTSIIAQEFTGVLVSYNTSSSRVYQTNNNTTVNLEYMDYTPASNNLISYQDTNTDESSIVKIVSSVNMLDALKTLLFTKSLTMYSKYDGIFKVINVNNINIIGNITNSSIIKDVKISKNKSNFEDGIDAMDYYYIESQEDMSDEEYEAVLNAYETDVVNPIKENYVALFNDQYKYLLEVEVFKDRITYIDSNTSVSINDSLGFNLLIGVNRDILLIGELIVSKIEELQYSYKLSGIAKIYDNSSRGSYSSSSTTLQATLQVNL